MTILSEPRILMDAWLSFLMSGHGEVRDYADGVSANEKAALYPFVVEIKESVDDTSEKFKELGGKLYLETE